MDVPTEVIERCQQGDPLAFEELIRLSQRDVYSLALRLTGNPDDAAEVAQETYLRLLRSIKSFRGEAKFSTWLYRVTSSVAITAGGAGNILQTTALPSTDPHVKVGYVNALAAVQAVRPNCPVAGSVTSAEFTIRELRCSAAAEIRIPPPGSRTTPGVNGSASATVAGRPGSSRAS